MSITHEIKNYWELIIAVFTGLGSLVGWLIRRKKNKQTSTQMLYEQMEVLKKKIILQTAEYRFGMLRTGAAQHWRSQFHVD